MTEEAGEARGSRLERPSRRMPDKGLPASAEAVLKLLGAGTVLTASMGWPAISLHYSRFGIPADLVTTEAAIRAGILPALTFMALFGYLWHVRATCRRLLKTEEGLRAAPFFLFQMAPFALLASAVRLLGWGCGTFLVMSWILGAVGVPVEPWGWLCWVLVAPSLLAGIAIFRFETGIFERLIFGDQRLEDEIEADADTGRGELSWMATLYLPLSDYKDFLITVAALHFISMFVHFFVPGSMAWFTLPAKLAVAALLPLSIELFIAGFTTHRGFGDMALGNLAASNGYFVFAALLAVLFYSVDLYPLLPKSLGGGRPEVAEVWVAESGAPALSAWRAASLDGENYHLNPTYLVRLDSSVAILVESPTPPADWVVLARDSITSVTSRSGP